MSDYGMSKKLDISFDQAVEKTISVLKEKGFGILTDIDVRATLKEKLGIEYKNYRILGACNPPRAHKALESEEEIGLLLPCNVIVYEVEDGVMVSAIDPVKAFSVVNNDSLKPVAEEVKQMLTEVIENL